MIEYVSRVEWREGVGKPKPPPPIKRLCYDNFHPWVLSQYCRSHLAPISYPKAVLNICLTCMYCMLTCLHAVRDGTTLF
jgi:hypothetical protein